MVSVVPVSDTELTPVTSLPSSTTITVSEFDRKPVSFETWVPNQCCTLQSISDEAELRLISGGTSYRVSNAFISRVMLRFFLTMEKVFENFFMSEIA